MFFALAISFVEKVYAEEDQSIKKGDIIINELMWMGMSGVSSDEWIELKNNTAKTINLETCHVTKLGDKDIVTMLNLKGQVIPAKSFYVISYKTKEDSKINVESHKALSYLGLSNSELLITLKCNDEIIDIAGNGKAPVGGENESIKKSMERNEQAEDGSIKTSWHTCINSVNLDEGATDCATPGEKNSEIEKIEPVEPKKYPTEISITELFPNPFKAQYEEYIELYNGTSEDVDLFGWKLHDASKNGNFTFTKNIVLKARKYLAIFKSDFKFALNNSGNESVTLFDPNGKEVAKASYDGSKRNVSYNFDGARFRWSKFLTPGVENILNNEPYGTLKIDKNIFKNAYANFSISTGDKDGDKVKVTWNFGDGHKSYLSKTRHKYLKIGIYEGNVKMSDGSEDVVKNFIVEVKKFPHPKVKIISINANPVGSDTLGESLVIENKSKEKINLEGWSIATGSKTLANHPIIEKFILKKKESKEITREISKFTLNNKKGKIELRYPDGEVADRIKYEKKDGIEEGEIYVKTKSGWHWIAKITNDKLQIPNDKQNTIDNIQNTEELMLYGEVAGAETIKREYSFVMLENNIVIGKMEFKNSDSRVLGAETVREVDGQYFLTLQSKTQQHYAIVFFKKMFKLVNLGLNMFLNHFSN